jgi:hypothetical protein
LRRRRRSRRGEERKKERKKEKENYECQEFAFFGISSVLAPYV